MARGVNKVILIGNLGGDPETRNLPSGGAVTTVTLATSETWKDKQTGQQQERTEWHRVVFFNRLAEIAGEYLRKGSKIYLEGSLRTRKWQDKQTGQDRYTTEIVASEMQMLDGARTNGEQYGDQYQQGGNYLGNSGPSSSRQPPPPAPNQPMGVSGPGVDGGQSFDDDIPF